MAVQQRALADRALQLLDLPANVPALLLDAGCGTGYSGRPLEKAGHTWIGTDISMNMLQSGVAAAAGSRSSSVGGGGGGMEASAGGRRRRVPQVLCDDLGRGFAFRNGVFDGCVSISAVQWLCHTTNPQHDPHKRVKKFFTALRAVLASGAKAVLQLYPEQPEHMGMLRDAAASAGFSGGLVVDYPWSERSKKLFLVLVAPKRDQAPQTWMGEVVGGRGNKEGGGGKGNDGKGNDGGGKGGGGKGKGKGGGDGGGRQRREPREPEDVYTPEIYGGGGKRHGKGKGKGGGGRGGKGGGGGFSGGIGKKGKGKGKGKGGGGRGGRREREE